MVRAALAREIGDGVYDDDEPEHHHHRIPLGLVMLAQGWITHPQLQKALEAQRLHGSGRIGEWLVSECGVQPERISRGLSVQWNCPVLSTESFWPEAMALALPQVFLEEYGAVPLRIAGKKILYVGFQDCLDASTSFALERMTGLRTENGVLPEAEFSRARQILLRCEFPRQTISAVSDRDGLVRAISETIEHEQPRASRLVRLHRYYWLRLWGRGGGDRAVGELPATASGVSDYLFTIGSRPWRSGQSEKKNQSVTVPVRQEAVVLPLEEPIEGAVPKISLVELEAVAALEIAGKNSSKEGAVVAGGETAAEDADAIEDKATDAPQAFVRTESDMDVEVAVVPEDIVVEPDIDLAVHEGTPVRHFLTRLEPRFEGLARGYKITEPDQGTPSEEPANLQRFMRRGFETEIEPIDGEYLPEKRTSDEATALASEDLPFGWNRRGLLRSSKPFFRDR
jgi:hypothetical protein